MWFDGGECPHQHPARLPCRRSFMAGNIKDQFNRRTLRLCQTVYHGEYETHDIKHM